jgi:hypothetical protein
MKVIQKANPIILELSAAEAINLREQLHTQYVGRGMTPAWRLVIALDQAGV